LERRFIRGLIREGNLLERRHIRERTYPREREREREDLIERGTYYWKEGFI
jgi:hypothetical protein